MQPIILESKDGEKLAELLDTGKFKKVLLPYWHGCGDVVLALPLFNKLKEQYHDIIIDIGLCKGLDQETIIADAILLDGDWRKECKNWDYDLVFPINFPTERLEDTTLTKSEICCIEELGIEPISGHLPIETKKICGVCFQCTSVPWLANADDDVAKKIWEDIKEAGFIGIEVIQHHVFFNPANKKYDFVDNHIRDWPARLATLIAVIKACDKVVSVVTGTFHLAMSILGAKNVMLLEKDLKAGHFTKEKIATANLKQYDNEVRTWLQSTV